MVKYILILVVSLGFIASAFAGNGNGKNCEELLLDSAPPGCTWVYECEANIDPSVPGGVPGIWTFEFSYTTLLRAKYYQMVTGFPPFDMGELSCHCSPNGSFTNPKWGASNSFLCSGPTNKPRRWAIAGHVVANGEAIIQGEAVNDLGYSWVFECVRVPDCPGG